MKRFGTMRNLVLVSTLGVFAAGCSKPEFVLDGLREDLRSPGYDTSNPGETAAAAQRASDAALPFANQSRPANVGGGSAVASWPQRAGNAQNLAPHAQFSANPQLVWASKGGAGNARQNRITAEPVSDGTRVYTMDSRAGVVAHAIGGAPVWGVDLTAPGEDKGTAMGGGTVTEDGA